MINIGKIPTGECRSIGRIYATDVLSVTFRKPIDTPTVDRGTFDAVLARRATACRKRRTAGPFRIRDGASSPPDGLEGCGSEYDKAGWCPEGS